MSDVKLEMKKPLEQTEELPLKQVRHNFIKKLMILNHIQKKILEREFQKTGVHRSQHQILMYVADHPNVSQKEIASLHHVSPATIAVTLKKMEKGGYITRQMDESDNRFNKIVLTEKGKLTVETSKKTFKWFEETLLDGITREEIQQTEAILRRMLDNFIRLSPEIDKEDLHC